MFLCIEPSCGCLRKYGPARVQVPSSNRVADFSTRHDEGSSRTQQGTGLGLWIEFGAHFRGAQWNGSTSLLTCDARKLNETYYFERELLLRTGCRIHPCRKGTLPSQLLLSVSFKELSAFLCRSQIAFLVIPAPIQSERRMVFRPGNLYWEFCSAVPSSEKRIHCLQEK
jgi:hypothetical protein